MTGVTASGWTLAGSDDGVSGLVRVGVGVPAAESVRGVRDTAGCVGAGGVKKVCGDAGKAGEGWFAGAGACAGASTSGSVGAVAGEAAVAVAAAGSFIVLTARTAMASAMVIRPAVNPPGLRANIVCV